MGFDNWNISINESVCWGISILIFQDIEGDTALHDAIAKGHDRAVNILLSHPNIDMTLVNKKDFHPLMFAALKENELWVDLP